MHRWDLYGIDRRSSRRRLRRVSSKLNTPGAILAGCLLAMLAAALGAWAWSQRESALRTSEAAAEKSGSWRMMAPFPLEPRTASAAVWTGKEMIVLGGRDQDARRGPRDPDRPGGYALDPRTGEKIELVQQHFRGGAIYNPESDRWRPWLLRQSLPAAAQRPFGRGRHCLFGEGRRPTSISAMAPNTIPPAKAGAGSHRGRLETCPPGRLYGQGAT